MSDNETTSVTTSIEDVPEWIATLVRGHHYDLRGEVFEVNVPRPCFAHQRAHLEEHAVLVVDTPGWDPQYDAESTRSTVVPMFDFRPNDGSADGALAQQDRSAAKGRLRSFDDAERMRLQRLAEKNAGLSDYTAPAAIEAARDAAAERQEPAKPVSALRPRPAKFPRRAATA